MLPDSIINRPKHGFEVPLLKWFRTGLRTLVHEELLHEERIREQGLFDAEQVKLLLQKLDSADPGDSAARVWALLVFQYWWTKHF